MCNFVSWVNIDGNLLYLTKVELNTKKGRKLIRELSYWPNDITGHGAIRRYYDIDGGKECECTRFSTPRNFPHKIASAIRNGEFRGIGLSLDLLNEKGRDTYNKEIKQYKDKYIEVCKSAYSEFMIVKKKITADYNQLAFGYNGYSDLLEASDKEYQIKISVAINELHKTEQSLFWDLFTNSENRNPVWR